MASPGVTFRFGVKSKYRNSTRFQETTSTTETWLLETDLDNYVSDLTITLGALWEYVQAERTRGAQVGLHYSISLENTTAPNPPTGAWVQAKQHLDGIYATDEWDNGTDGLLEQLTTSVQLMQRIAEY